MGLFTTLKSLFAPLPEGAVRYKGFTITATPEQDGNRYRLRGSITKKDQTRCFSLVDTVTAEETCVQLTHKRAKLFIDHRGEEIFI